MTNIIGRGAEAILYHKENVVKDRVSKGYRLKQIDDELRRARTRREAKVLEKLAEIGIAAPKLVDCDRQSVVEMEFIEGSKLRDVFEEKDFKVLGSEIGMKIAIMHNNGIIHGDLTTSNMILNDEVVLIDFGLSFFSEKIEDKAVDLHLLRQALESKHHMIWKDAFDAVIAGYKKESSDFSEVMDRYAKVEMRGRNKGKD